MFTLIMSLFGFKTKLDLVSVIPPLKYGQKKEQDLGPSSSNNSSMRIYLVQFVLIQDKQKHLFYLKVIRKQ